MSGEWIKWLSPRAAPIWNFDVERKASLNECVAQNCFKRFKEDHTSPCGQNEGFLKMVERPRMDPVILSVELGPSQGTINRHRYKLWFVVRGSREFPHELTNDQVQRRVNICKVLLANRKDARFWHRHVTGDKKCINFRNLNKINNWLLLRSRFRASCQPRVVWAKFMLCVCVNFDELLHLNLSQMVILWAKNIMLNFRWFMSFPKALWQNENNRLGQYLNAGENLNALISTLVNNCIVSSG